MNGWMEGRKGTVQPRFFWTDRRDAFEEMICACFFEVMNKAWEGWEDWERREGSRIYSGECEGLLETLTVNNLYLFE